VSGREDILNVVTAMRNGAFDYLEKRLDANVIVARVFEAIEAWKQFREREEKPQIISPAIRNYYQLTRREREVLAHIAAAASNKETGRNLGISPRTVEIHRGRIMHKLGAKNSVDLMRIVMNTRQSRDEHAAPAQTAAP
jgi:two-component system response regulator FixJ